MHRDDLLRLLKRGTKAWNSWRSRNGHLPIELEKIHLSDLDLGFAQLDGADFEGSALRDINFNNSVLSRADMHNAGLYNSTFVRAMLTETNFLTARLNGCDLSQAILSDATFIGTKFKNTTLVGADLSRATVQDAVFEQVSLRGCKLMETVFERCDFFDVDFAAATLDGTKFIDSNLRGTRGLEDTQHTGPSSIDVSTIYQSDGRIHESFLRDVGVPEGLIIQIPSLISAQVGIQFYSCFISYSHKNEEFANRLFSRLRDAKLRVWYAPEEMKGGQKLHEQIETAIRVHDKLLLVLSEASLASEWVKTEIRNARRQERMTSKRKLFPVRLVDMETIQEWSEFDADSGKDLGVELREYYIPDFSAWKEHDKFEAEFKKLLRDLKAESKTPRGLGI